MYVCIVEVLARRYCLERLRARDVTSLDSHPRQREGAAALVYIVRRRAYSG